MRKLFPLLLLLLSACAVNRPVPQDSFLGEEEAPISIQLAGTPDSTGTKVRFITAAQTYTHLVQELTLDSGETLIEAFRIDGLIYDLHSWPKRPHWRTMTIYAAVVDGMDEMGGWGHLPDNGAGLETTVGKGFNAHYQSAYETRGRIIVRSPLSYTWRIDDNGKTITVSLP